MSIFFDSYFVNDIKILWGTSFKEVTDLLKNQAQFKPYGGWKNIRCSCNEVFGIKANEVEIRAPFDDRPVLQVNYQLSPIPNREWGNFHSPYIDALINVLGLPVKTVEDYPKEMEDNLFVSNKVVFNCSWLLGDIRISLSVYGGIRKEQSGESAAGLFIDWISEKKAAVPFIKKNKELEQKIKELFEDSGDFKKFNFDHEHRKFLIKHFSVGVEDVYKDEELRKAQMTLYKNDLVSTPVTLHEQLSEKEVAIKFTNNNKMVIANKWDATFVNKEEVSKIIFTDIQPARGSGLYMLDVKDFSISCSRDSNRIIEIVELIELKLGTSIKKVIGSDD